MTEPCPLCREALVRSAAFAGVWRCDGCGWIGCLGDDEVPEQSLTGGTSGRRALADATGG